MKRDGSLNWIEVTLVSAIVKTKTRRLVLSVAQREGRWSAIAIEGSASAETPGEVFDDHAHVDLGKADTLQEAEKIAEKYAKEWLRGRRVEERCLCEDIRSAVRRIATRKSA